MRLLVGPSKDNMKCIRRPPDRGLELIAGVIDAIYTDKYYPYNDPVGVSKKHIHMFFFT